MEENKSYINEEPAIKRIIPIIIYVLIIFLLAGLIMLLIAQIYSNIKNIAYDDIIKTYNMSAADFKTLSPDLLKANAITQGYANLIGYLLAALSIGYFVYKDFKEDFIKLKENKKFYLWFIPVSTVLFVGISYLVDYLVGLAAESSENQLQIVNILENGGFVPMLISTVILAPLVEELVFRKCIFSLCGKKKIIFAYLLSIILFVLPHMLSTKTDIGMWLLQSIPYLVSAIMFAVIYHLSKFNIYATMIAHICNNILAIILVFAVGGVAIC